jgi:hypothetical protein
VCVCVCVTPKKIMLLNWSAFADQSFIIVLLATSASADW